MMISGSGTPSSAYKMHYRRLRFTYEIIQVLITCSDQTSMKFITVSYNKNLFHQKSEWRKFINDNFFGHRIGISKFYY